MAAPGASGEWITLAVVIKTQGRRGEVAVDPHTDIPDRFRQKMRLSALDKEGARRTVTIEDLWPHKSFLVLKFEGVAPGDHTAFLSDVQISGGNATPVPEPNYIVILGMGGIVIGTLQRYGQRPGFLGALGVLGERHLKKL